MRRTTRLTVMRIALIALLATFAAPLYAQHGETMSLNRKGMARFPQRAVKR